MRDETTTRRNERNEAMKTEIADLNRKDLTARLADLREYTADAAEITIEKLRARLLFALGLDG